MKNKNLLFLLSIVIFAGCSSVTEPVKLVLGTSVAKLEAERVNANAKTYKCSYRDCFNAILALGKNEDEYTPTNEKYFTVFQKNWKKGFIVVMGIEGQVDTTEVGIFFGHVDDYETTLEITSLSSSAKTKVANAVFAELDHHFTETRNN